MMRACFRRAVVLLALLVSLTGAAHADCGQVTAFIEKLNAGNPPAELPDLQSCHEEFAPDLAKALAGYVQKSSPADVAAVVGSLKAAYQKADRRKAYAQLATLVEAELAPYSALDGVSRYARPAPPAAPAPPSPVVKPAPPPADRGVEEKKQPPKDRWIISPQAGAIALWIVCTVAGAALLGYLVITGRRADAQQAEVHRRLQELGKIWNAELAELGTALQRFELKLGRIDTAHQVVAKRLETWSERFPADARILAPQHLEIVSAEIRALRSEVVRDDGGHATAAAASDPVALEREVLAESWKKFRTNKELSDSVDNATNDERWKQIYPLLSDLPRLVPDDLKPACEAALAPARDYNNLVAKIAVIPRLVSGQLRRHENDAQELMRTREFTNLLSMSQSSTFSERLNFHLKSWIRDNFLSFADLYLQRYQQARMEKRSEPALEEGAQIVKQILRAAAVEPIDLELGETPFDSVRHVGRSTVNDARFSDGVIVGVVRNGFTEAGQQVIRQPEVVVNRTR